MTRKSDGPSWHTFWDGFPERIRVTEAALRHILYRHPELLGDQLAHEFWRECQKSQADPAILAAIADKLKPPTVNPSNGLMYVEYREDANGSYLHTTRILLLPCASVRVLRLTNGLIDLQTAYSAWQAVATTQNERLRAARRRLVVDYAQAEIVNGRKLLVLPSPDHKILLNHPPGCRTAVRFNTPEKWGFVPIKLGDEILWVWQPPPWAASLVVPKNVLKKRKLSGQ